MSEEERFAEMFDEKWLDKYIVSWCHLCDTVKIRCPACSNISCSSGGCTECSKDFPLWDKVKKRVEDYLSPEESEIYRKGKRLQKYIIESIVKGENEIDWVARVNNGEISQNDEETFRSLIEAKKS